MLTNTVLIKSSSSDTRLELSELDEDYYIVAIKGLRCNGMRHVWSHEGDKQFTEFFQSMALDWKGWTGEKQCSSLENELALTGSINKTGHVTLKVTLTDHENADTWRLDANLTIDAGQLESLSKEVASFFKNRSK